MKRIQITVDVITKFYDDYTESETERMLLKDIAESTCLCREDIDVKVKDITEDELKEMFTKHQVKYNSKK